MGSLINLISFNFHSRTDQAFSPLPAKICRQGQRGIWTIRITGLLFSAWILVNFSAIVDAAYGADSNDARHEFFASSSFWYSRLPLDAPWHPHSEAFTHDFIRQYHKFYGNVAINTDKYSAPIYVVANNVETTPVTQWDCQNKGFKDQQLEQQWRAVPIPPGAEPADGADSEMTIYQPSTDTMWEFWQARKGNGRWEACWGGRMPNVSNSNGIWPRPYGTTATGLPFLGGEIRAEELTRGAISHVMGIALVETAGNDVYSWPANRSDGYNPSNSPNRIPEGLRFRLDPTIDLDALGMHPVGRIVAKAAQTYGFVVWDKAGAISLRAENPKSFTTTGLPNPYPAIWNGTATYQVLRGFPWERLQFLPMNYGRP